MSLTRINPSGENPFALGKIHFAFGENVFALEQFLFALRETVFDLKQIFFGLWEVEPIAREIVSARKQFVFASVGVVFGLTASGLNKFFAANLRGRKCSSS